MICPPGCRYEHNFSTKQLLRECVDEVSVPFMIVTPGCSPCRTEMDRGFVSLTREGRATTAPVFKCGWSGLRAPTASAPRRLGLVM